MDLQKNTPVRKRQIEIKYRGTVKPEITTTFRGTVWNFYYQNDHWTMTTCKQRPQGWSLYTGLTVQISRGQKKNTRRLKRSSWPRSALESSTAPNRLTKKFNVCAGPSQRGYYFTFPITMICTILLDLLSHIGT